MKQPKEFQEAKETLATYMVTEIASKYIKADSTAEGKSAMNGWYKVALKHLKIAINQFTIEVGVREGAKITSLLFGYEMKPIYKVQIGKSTHYMDSNYCKFSPSASRIINSLTQSMATKKKKVVAKKATPKKKVVKAKKK